MIGTGPRQPVPLRVTARLDGAIALPGGPLALDSLLAAAVAAREHLPPPAHAGDCAEIEIPIAREPGGRFHLASFSLSHVEVSERRWVNRRFPIPEAQALGGPKLRRVNISGGPAKSYRLPLETSHLVDDTLTWWCVGDRAQIEELLAGVTHLGKRRAVGLGRVREWIVEETEESDGFPVVLDGLPLRPLPADWPGLSPEAVRAYRTLTYPYWDHAREVECAVPEGGR